MRAQAAPAPRPASALIRQGQADFMKAPCASCHRIRGTSAVGDIGPDLTHLASRTSLAALATDNSPAGLLRWISDPQHIKPGAKMPDLALSARQFRAIASYLRTLR